MNKSINWLNLLTIGLTITILVLQAHLWFGQGSVLKLWSMQRELKKQDAEVLQMRRRNEFVQNEFKSLSQNHDAIEERARYDLNMIKNNEVFVQFIANDQSMKN